MNRRAERQRARCFIVKAGSGTLFVSLSRASAHYSSVLVHSLACYFPHPYGQDLPRLLAAIPPAIRHINRRTRPEVCLYLPSCRRTHPAPCIRSLLALTRLLCGLPKPCCPPTGSCRSSLQHAWPAHELQFCVLLHRPIPTPGLLLLGCSFYLGRLALSSGTCRRIHNDTNLNTTTPTYAHRPAAPACRDPSQRPPCAPSTLSPCAN